MTLEIAQINRYSKNTTAKLKIKAQNYFNAFIRDRDKDSFCISCQKSRVEQAGHFYSAGHHNHLRFNEDNVHGQCLRCNYYLCGNLNKYRINLQNKIGKERLAKLDLLASQKTAHKLDRFYLIEICEKYRKK
jgi:hypothetical protein